jgi:hypothetical protein
MHNTTTYYNHLKPLEILYVPPCFEIQHPILPLDPTFTSHACAKSKNLRHLTRESYGQLFLTKINLLTFIA